MSPEIIRISKIEDKSSLESCTPSLMPFHIAYTGPAPMSTFFRVKENTEPIAGASSAAEVPLLPPTSSSRLVGRVTKRLLAAFRGRVVQGVEMALPDGYGGLILRSNSSKDGSDEKKEREVRRGKVESRGRRGTRAGSTRKATPEPVRETDDDEDIEETRVAANSGDEVSTKELKVSHTFSSLIVWNPDILVDQGKDEYTRALTEWTAVAAELHRPESD